jgi:hypothetical protein
VYVRSLNNIKFMDSPLPKQVERLCGYMVDSNLEIGDTVVDEEIAKEIGNHLLGYFSSLEETNGPPREIIDRTKTSKPHQRDEQYESSDPDDPDFANNQ